MLDRFTLIAQRLLTLGAVIMRIRPKRYLPGMDLPMAFKRWCADTGSESLVCASDYKDHGFGTAYGLRIKELGLLTRAVIVADKDGKVVHAETVGEVTEHPDYDAALAAAKAAL